MKTVGDLRAGNGRCRRRPELRRGPRGAAWLVAPRHYQVRFGPRGESLGATRRRDAPSARHAVAALGTLAADDAADRLLRVTLRSAGSKAGDWSKPVTVTV